MMLEPVVAVLLAALLLAEAPSALQIVGGLLVITAGAILQLPTRGVPHRARAEAA